MKNPKRPLKVFLCHSSLDKSEVREFSRLLNAEGWIDAWLDEKKLLPGHDWRLKIEDAVETSDIVIICLSKNSVTKEGYVQKEIRYAREIALEKPEETIFIIPLRLGECDIPRGLRFYQWVDYFGEKKGEAYRALLESLKLRHNQKIRFEEEELTRREKEKAEREVVEKAAKERVKREAPKKAAIEKTVPEISLSSSKAKKYIPYFIGLFVVAVFVVIGNLVFRQPGYVPSIKVTPTVMESKNDLIIATQQAEEITRATAAEKAQANQTGRVQATQTARVQATQTTLAAKSRANAAEITDAFGVEMVLVPAGEFTMGSESGIDTDKPAHTVDLDAFYIDKYEVTNALYKACVEDARVCVRPQKTNSSTRSSYYEDSEFIDYPVIYIDWYMAKTYCEWRGAQLPTEAQWEKAARGTDEQRIYPWGKGIDCNKANYSGCLGDTNEIGSYEDGVSPYGLYDMAGNVWEWVADWYLRTYYKNSPESNPLGPDSGFDRVLRGGSWSNNDSIVYSANRGWYNPAKPASNIGFRCARSISAGGSP